MTEQPYELTISQAAVSLRDGSLTAQALTESVLARIADTEPQVNAYITVTADLAREQAATADAELRDGRDRGPLHGIPFAVKDLYDTAGIATTAGSAFFAERVPDTDAFVMQKLADAGIALTGKLGMAEFAMGLTSTNPHFDPVRNPWNTDRVPGGSSGGSGAAIAAASCLGSLGSDTGGSIRVPASLCGIVGLMPTYGRVSRSGVLPLSWTLDHVGPLTKTVEDSAIILNAIAGHDPADPGSVDVPVDDYTSALGRDLRGLRVGVPRDPLWRDCDDEIVAACEAALGVLQELGATVATVEMPVNAGVPDITIMHAEGAAYHADRMRTDPARFGADVRARLERGALIPATTYINEQRLRRHMMEENVAVLHDVDVLVSPTTPVTAPVIDFQNTYFHLRNLTWRYAVTGVPAISVPCGFDSAGLPIGLQIAGRHFDEVTVCRVAHAYEQATDWHRRRPAL